MCARARAREREREREGEREREMRRNCGAEIAAFAEKKTDKVHLSTYLARFKSLVLAC